MRTKCGLKVLGENQWPIINWIKRYSHMSVSHSAVNHATNYPNWKFFILKNNVVKTKVLFYQVKMNCVGKLCVNCNTVVNHRLTVADACMLYCGWMLCLCYGYEYWYFDPICKCRRIKLFSFFFGSENLFFLKMPNNG